MKAYADEHGGGDAGQQGWIRRRIICGMAIDETWDEKDGEMGWKDCDGLGNINR